ALLADHPAVLHALVLAAVALVVLHRPKDLRAEQTVALGLEGAVVDGLRLLHFAVRPLPDLLRRCQADADRRERERIFRLLEEVEDVFHEVAPFFVTSERKWYRSTPGTPVPPSSPCRSKRRPGSGRSSSFCSCSGSARPARRTNPSATGSSRGNRPALPTRPRGSGARSRTSRCKARSSTESRRTRPATTRAL